MSDESISEEGIFNPFDFAYSTIAKNILDTGETRKDRTGVGTISVFGRILRFDLREGFPLLTTKKVPFKSVLSELLWFLEGSSDERRLAEILYGKDRVELEGKTTIWTANAQSSYWKPKAKFEGDLGEIYGVIWRKCPDPYTGGTIDQIAEVIEGIKTDPFGRRHIVETWNPAAAKRAALPPCHKDFQFVVSAQGELHCRFDLRSVDVLLGMPFNIASYALLTMMVAQVCDLTPGDLVMTTGDTHIYLNHLDQINEQLTRSSYAPPKVVIDPSIKNIDDFRMEHFTLVDYQSHGPLSAPMAV
jgi:thymidylate synthase